MSFLHNNVVNSYISCELNKWDLNTDFILGNCLFGAVKLAKNADTDKYKYSGYGIGFDSRSQFSWSDGSWNKNFIIFGADVSTSVHVHIKRKIY